LKTRLRTPEIPLDIHALRINQLDGEVEFLNAIDRSDDECIALEFYIFNMA
jgi:hypothetical protein